LPSYSSKEISPPLEGQVHRAKLQRLHLRRGLNSPRVRARVPARCQPRCQPIAYLAKWPTAANSTDFDWPHCGGSVDRSMTAAASDLPTLAAQEGEPSPKTRLSSPTAGRRAGRTWHSSMFTRFSRSQLYRLACFHVAATLRITVDGLGPHKPQPVHASDERAIRPRHWTLWHGLRARI
jgi:hypothetical protein